MANEEQAHRTKRWEDDPFNIAVEPPAADVPCGGFDLENRPTDGWQNGSRSHLWS